jgi:hypothetical protein
MRPKFRNIGLAAFVVVGCGGGGGGASVAVDQFASQYTAALCHKIFTCCDPTEIAEFGTLLDATVVDEATCAARSTARYEAVLASDKARVDAGRAAFQADQGRACVDAVSALTCSAWGGPFTANVLPQCEGLFVGTSPIGSACDTGEECATGFCGARLAGGNSCMPLAKRGESCADAPCPLGLACVSNPPSGGPLMCGDPLADGLPCMYDPDCASGRCATDAATGESVCSPEPTSCTGS